MEESGYDFGKNVCLYLLKMLIELKKVVKI